MIRLGFLTIRANPGAAVDVNELLVLCHGGPLVHLEFPAGILARRILANNDAQWIRRTTVFDHHVRRLHVVRVGRPRAPARVDHHLKLCGLAGPKRAYCGIKQY